MASFTSSDQLVLIRYLCLIIRHYLSLKQMLTIYIPLVLDLQLTLIR
nr:MAG TPA: hypothetical protein [Bacteriophage sp.]